MHRTRAISIPAAPEWYQIRAAKVGRKVESRGQQIIRAIFSFLTPPSTVNSQQSTITDGATGIDINSWESLRSKNPHIFRPGSVKNRWFSRLCVRCQDIILNKQLMINHNSGEKSIPFHRFPLVSVAYI
jgi:hypothetical protein